MLATPWAANLDQSVPNLKRHEPLTGGKTPMLARKFARGSTQLTNWPNDGFAGSFSAYE